MQPKIRNGVDFRVDDPCHILGAADDVPGIFTGEAFENGRAEQLQPAGEERPVHAGPFQELEMRGDEIATKTAGPEKDAVPERADLR